MSDHVWKRVPLAGLVRCLTCGLIDDPTTADAGECPGEPVGWDDEPLYFVDDPQCEDCGGLESNGCVFVEARHRYGGDVLCDDCYDYRRDGR